MFEQLTEKLQKTLKYIRGEGKITEKNIAEALKMLRLAFLEADVNYKVVKEFEEKVKARALNQEVMMSLTPGQQFIKIVRDELTEILGQEARNLTWASHPPSVFMLVGLQGSGKTTTAGKLGRYVQGQGKNPLLVSFDLKRLAAQDQLRIIARSLDLPFYEMTADRMKKPEEALKELLTYSRNRGYDPLIVDTAGRLHIDDELMAELRLARDILQPAEVIYVGDAMTGQDAVRSAQAFEEKIRLTSIILTKMDGDARGGAALSITYVTHRPIKFIGVGEKFDKLEVFHPDRMASRILGMGDILSLIEKAEAEADLKQAEEMARKLKKNQFTLEDFRQQLVQLKKMGSFSGLMNFLPKVGPFKNIGNLNIDDKKLIYFEAIINSMTREERENPRIIDGRRRARIARGSGRPVQEVNQLLKQFFEMEKLLKKGTFQKLLNA
ncbi:MAG TPA: signal recognition particle protein [Candidatus Saccharicenans sp.]|nr:signal recognition particle protein [Candidatus Saccharicenans sp.]HQM74848.1 signal recognition particle protein [Candidatus Saccharicenans sp.]